MSVNLRADGGEITIGARTAVYTYGAFNVILPQGKQLAEDDYTDAGYTNGYVYKPAGAEKLGRFDVAFVRADVTVDTNAGYTNLEAVLDQSQKKVQEDIFFERDIERAGLGGWTPGKDFHVGDLVEVTVFDRVIRQPVTAITHTTNEHDPLGVKVHIGGQTIRDDELVSEQNRAIKEAIAKESATRRAQNKNTRDMAVAARRDGVVARSDAAAAKDAAAKAVVDQVFEFAAGASRVEAPVSGWSQAYPGDEAGVVWQRSVTYFGDGRVERGPAVVTTGAPGPRGPQGPKGDPGKDGVPGKNGVGVRDTTITYAASASGTQAPTSGWGIQPPASVPAGQFVWTKTTLHYTDNTTEDIYTVGKIGETGPQGPRGATGAQGPKGATGSDGRPGKDGTKLTSTTVTYSASNSGTKAPSSGWQSQPPTAAPGRYIWTRFIWTYSDGTSETGYSVGKLGETGPRGPQGAKGSTGATGPQGPKGNTGAPGVSVVEVVRCWQWSRSKPSQPSGSGFPIEWSTTQPAYQVGATLWTVTATMFSNGQWQWSHVTEEASVSAATAIAAESASTKNRVWYAASAPGSTRGEREGDTWFQYSGTTIVGQWRWTGSSWVTQTIGDQVIANLDAGKITSGIIDARRIKAGSIDASKIKADSITVKELRAEVFHQVGVDVVPLKPGTTEPAWWDQADDEITMWVQPMDPKLVKENNLPTAYQFVPTADYGGTPVKMKRVTRTKRAVHYNLVTVDPDKEYDLSFIAYGHVGGRYYIECLDQDGRHAVKSGGVNKIGERDIQTGTIYLAQNVPTDGMFRYYHTRIRFNDPVRAIRIGSIYGNHPNGAQGEGVWIGDIRISPHQVDQAQIDALQDKQIADNKARIATEKKYQAKIDALQNRQITDNKAVIKRLDYLATSIRAVGRDEWCTDRELGYGVIMPRSNRYMVLLRTKKFKESLQPINALVFYSNKVKHYCMGYYRETIPGNSVPAWGPVRLGGVIDVDRNALNFVQGELGTTDLEMAHFFVELGDIKSAIILAGA